MCSVSVLVHVSSYPPPPDAASWCTARVSCVCELPPTPRAQSSPPLTHYTTTIRRFHTLQDGTLFPRLAIVQKLLTWQLILFNYFRVTLYFTFDPAAVQCWLVDRTCGGSWDGNDLCTLRGQADECEKWCWWWVCEGVPASTRHETTRVARANQQGVRGVWCGGVVCVGVWCVWGVWCGVVCVRCVVWGLEGLFLMNYGSWKNHCCTVCTYTVGSRYSGSLKYGHLDIPAIWFGTECYLYVYCTKLTLKYGHSLFRLPASAGCPK